MAELSPLNPAIRGGAWGVSQMAGGGRHGGALALGVSTLLLEAASVVALCRWVLPGVTVLTDVDPVGGGLLRRALDRRVLLAVRRWLRTSPGAATFAVVLAAPLVGAAVGVLALHLVRPGLPPARARRLGLTLAVALAALAAAQGWVLAWAAEHPVVVVGGAAVAAVLGLLAVLMVRVRRGATVPTSVPSTFGRVLAERPA